MIDLQMFFQKLFHQNPQLHFLPLTIEFFEIESIVLNTPITSKEREKEKYQDLSNSIKATTSFNSSNYNSYSSTSIFGSITTFNNSFERRNASSNTTESRSKYDL
jgi:hypothetical protein